MTFREFLNVLAARWRIIALSLLAVIAATSVQTMMTPAVYTSTAKIFLSATQPPDPEHRTAQALSVTPESHQLGPRRHIPEPCGSILA